MNDQFKRIRKEAAVAYLTEYSDIFLELLKKTTKKPYSGYSVSQPRCKFSTSQGHMPTILPLNQFSGEILFLKKSSNNIDIILSLLSD
jgi:hypothetical protein